MKQYEKIYAEIMDGDGEQATYIRTEIHKKAIVITIEELREVWDAAQEHMLPPHGSPGFTKLLQSKGITIK
jgi:hypothetical protein